MKTLLNVSELKAGYGAAQVLFDVNFTVSKGEVVTLLGRNGMGRSTTIKCLFGLLPVKGGVIELGGQRIDNAPSHRIARLGLGYMVRRERGGKYNRYPESRNNVIVYVYMEYDPVEEPPIRKWTSLNPDLIPTILGKRKALYISDPVWSEYVCRIAISFLYVISADMNKRSCRSENPSSE